MPITVTKLTNVTSGINALNGLNYGNEKPEIIDILTTKLDEITNDWQSMGSFNITLDPDTNTGWHPTNDGFKLTYLDKDKNNNFKAVIYRDYGKKNKKFVKKCEPFFKVKHSLYTEGQTGFQVSCH